MQNSELSYLLANLHLQILALHHFPSTTVWLLGNVFADNQTPAEQSHFVSLYKLIQAEQHNAFIIRSGRFQIDISHL